MRLGSRTGDTIIEVLVSMAIIGMVLGASYTMVSRSLGVSRTTQERTEALKYAESQIEQIRALDSTAKTTLYSQTSDFCLDNLAILPSSNTACKKDFYNIAVSKGVGADNSDFFTVKIHWLALGKNAGNPNELKIVYRYDR